MREDDAVSIQTRWGETVSVSPGDFVELAGLPRTWFQVVFISHARTTADNPSPAIELVAEDGRPYRSVVSSIVDVRR
jgi:hypothetical protein